MMEVEEPRRLGRYEILRPLARGGMAELFLARATGIQRFEKLVVVKRILPEMARDTEYVEMFLEEARLAAGLHHSNIVQVYDIGEDEETPFFAMEYLQGEDVRTLFGVAQRRGERVPVEHALSIVIGVAAGLHHAHEQCDADGKPLGIVHRDVSPHNVAVTFDGGVKLLDFGVAKTTTRRRASATRHGTLKGKLGYMSPEQCRGDELDRRSDVFAIAILLWELLTGRRLYGGRSDWGVMKSIVETDAPRPSLVWHDCPPELEAIVMRGLRREREARQATAEELQLALEAFARERRLAVSTAGLGHYVRELFAARVGAGAAEGERTSALYDVAATDDDDAAATVVDGVVASAATAAEAPRARMTRAVARPSRRPWLWPALAAGVVAAGVVGWRVAPLTRAKAPPPSVVAPETVSAPPAIAPRPSAPPPVASPPPPTRPSALDPPRLEVEPAPTPRTPTTDRPTHVRATKHNPHARPHPRIDLDAPLPPK
jgi:tRNA A-37 threonylcarbamoyl transferase component Bud32